MSKIYVYGLFKGIYPYEKVSRLYVNEKSLSDGIYPEHYEEDEDVTLHGVGDEGGEAKREFDYIEDAVKCLKDVDEAYCDEDYYVGCGIEYLA